jgi:hypothetical protein
MAYGLYAGGHLGPAFALLSIAAGVSLTLVEHPSPHVTWFITGGVAGYLVGTRAVSIPGTGGFGPVIRLAVVAVTACLALLQPWLTATGVLAVATAFAIIAAVVVSSQRPALLDQVMADPMVMFRRHHGR